jgi:hypothetical protein
MADGKDQDTLQLDEAAPQTMQLDEEAGGAAPQKQEEPGMLEKAWNVAKTVRPFVMPSISDVSGGLQKLSEWAGGKAEQAQQERLGRIATGKEQAEAPGGGAAATGYDLLARTARMGAGMFEPKNVAIGAGAALFPEVVGPALIAHGGYGALGAVGDIAKQGANPENVEQLLTSGAEMAGGAAGGGEAVRRAQQGTLLSPRLAAKVFKGTPLTEQGKLAAAQQQALTVKKPSMSETEYAGRVQAAMPDLIRVAQENRGQIKTPREATAALNNRISQIEAPIRLHLDTVPDAQQMVDINTVRQRVNTAIDQAFQGNAGHYTPEEMTKARDKVLNFLGDQDKPLREVEGNRHRLNDDANAYYNTDTAGRRSIDVSDATARAQRAAADEIRNIEYGDQTTPGELERVGIRATDTQGNPVDLRQVRRQVGNLINIRDHFEDAITRAEATGDWSPFAVMKSGPSLAAGGLGGAAGMLAGGPVGSIFGLMAGEGAKVWTDYLRSKNPNLNVFKMFRNLEQVRPQPTSDIQATMPAPLAQPPAVAPVGRQLPQPVAPPGMQLPPPTGAGGVPVPAPGPGPVNPPMTRQEMQGGRWVTPIAQIPPTITPATFVREIPPERPAMMPPRIAGELPGVGQTNVPRETNVPPMAEVTREEVRPPAGAEERTPETQLGPMGRGGIRQPVRGELERTVPAHEVAHEIDRLELAERDLRRQGNVGAANAVNVKIRQLREQVPAGFENLGTVTGRPVERVGREGTLGRVGEEAPKKKVGEGEEEVPYTRPMPIPSSRLMVTKGVTNQAVLHHELGHVIVGGLNGFPSSGVASHRVYGPGGPSASTLFSRTLFRDPVTGGFNKELLTDRVDQIAELFAAGAATNELVDNIPRGDNPGLVGDRRMVKEFFKAFDIPEDQHEALFDAAIDRAKDKLTPHADLIRDEATRREENLPVQYHFSKNRVSAIMDKVRGATREPTAQGELFNAPSGAAAGYRGGEETVPGREGPGPQGAAAKAPEPLKPFSPPRNVYDFHIHQREGPPIDDTIEAINRKRAFDIVLKKYPTGTHIEMMKETRPEVGPPYEEAPFEKEKEEPGPLRGMVSDKDAAARVNRKLNRKEGIGDPKSPALVVHDEEGRPYVFGNATPEQLMLKWQAHLDPETITKWRNWYPDIGKQFEAAYGKGKEAASKMMAWLGSQQNTSPSGGLMNVERAIDIRAGQKRIKTAGLAENNIMSMLAGKTPEGGYGPKLHDFVDSALQRKTRTVMGDDPRGGAPAVVDIHGARGMGFVDPTLKNFVEKKFGKEAANKLTEDFSGMPTETQYEYGAEKMNRIADELNRRGFMGGGWTPDQVQAVDWGATIKQFGREPELPNSIFDRNTRRLSYEVKFSENSPYARRFPNLGDLEYAKSMGITRDVAQKAMDLIQKEAGGRVLRNVYGPGGWLQSVSPSAGSEFLSSPEAAERATNMLGYLLQQDAVLTSRPMLSGGGHEFTVIEPGGETLRDPEKVGQFWSAFRELYPKAEGFMPVETPEGNGIRVLKVRGHFSAKDVEALDKAASHAADRVNIGKVETSHGPADVHMASNDWSKNPDGKGYLQRIKEIGRPGVQGRLRNELAPAIERAIRDAFRKHTPEQAKGGASLPTQAAKRIAAK